MSAETISRFEIDGIVYVTRMGGDGTVYVEREGSPESHWACYSDHGVWRVQRGTGSEMYTGILIEAEPDQDRYVAQQLLRMDIVTGLL